MKSLDIYETTEFTIEDLGIQEVEVYDIEVDEVHNFFANDILVHNSQYIQMDRVVDQFCKEDPVDFLEEFSSTVQGWIKDSLESLYRETNVFQEKLFMALEAIGPGIWVAKKRYIMSLPSFKKIRYDPPRIKIMGIEAVRSTTPLVARNWFTDGIPLILNGTDVDVKKFIDERWQEFISLPFDDIAMPKGTNDLEKYMNKETIYGLRTPLHVRGALLYNHYLKKNEWDIDLDVIRSGDRVKVMYLKVPNPLMENVISTPEQIPSQFKEFERFIDYNKQFDKVFYDAFKRITDAAGVDLTSNISMDSFYG